MYICVYVYYIYICICVCFFFFFLTAPVDRLFILQWLIRSQHFGRNNNSSRFGKYNRVFFDETGTLVDASVSWKPMECERHPFLPPDDLNGF